MGDAVGVDDVIAEVETDKTSVPVPSPVAGVIVELLVEDGATVQAGKELAKIKAGAAGAAPPAAAKPAEKKVGIKGKLSPQHRVNERESRNMKLHSEESHGILHCRSI